MKTSHNAHRRFADRIGYNPDLVREIFRFLPFDALLKMMLVSKQWKKIAREDSFWRDLCQTRFPESFECLQTIRKEVGDYYNAFKVWYGIHRSNGMEQSSIPSKPPISMRFSLENLITYIQVQHRGDIIWSHVQHGKSPINSRLEIDKVPPISCSFGMIPKDLQIRVSFLHVDSSSRRIWVCDRYLQPERATVSFSEKPFLLIIAKEGSSGVDRFLGELRFLITQLDGAGFELSLQTFFTSFLKPALTNQFNVPDRHLLTLLRRNLRWRQESIDLQPLAQPIDIYNPPPE
jgi:hypothetical protein